ncbi:unnamed protein product [Brassica rapa subsp. narinosa]
MKNKASLILRLKRRGSNPYSCPLGATRVVCCIVSRSSLRLCMLQGDLSLVVPRALRSGV